MVKPDVYCNLGHNLCTKPICCHRGFHTPNEKCKVICSKHKEARCIVFTISIPEKPTCKNCKFSIGYDCCRYPQFLINNQKVFPFKSNHNWCGEHQYIKTYKGD